MTTTEKLQSWRSIHTDYLSFAVISYLASHEESPSPAAGAHIDRNVFDTIRYSFDCLEASIEYVYSMGRLRQLPVSIPINWLTRYAERAWRNLSLSDRIGILAYAWTHTAFWENERQFRLFTEWKKVRDGLTHPIPFGTEIEREIIKREEVEDGAILTMSRFVGDERQIGPEAMSFTSQASLAHFSENPTSLATGDAAKALELLLRHLIRLESLFFNARITSFTYSEFPSKTLLSPHDLLAQLPPVFNEVW
jgi:hypothetical protein